MPEDLNPAERLLNLVIALVNTNAAMTKQQVRTAVAGYTGAPSDDAFERMFERDKDMLRELGIPIATVGGGGHTDELGYRIDPDAYALPPVDLTPAELGVLSLAAQFWADKTLRTDIARAMTKLRAAGAGDAAQDALAGLAPRVRAVGAAYGPLLEAIDARRAVSFTYRAASTGEVRTRHVEPWRIAARGGGWYLLSFDRERRAPRVFRLSRVEGRVKIFGPAGAYEIPGDLDTDAMLGKASGEVRTAVLAILPERAGALRARGKVVSEPRGPREVPQRSEDTSWGEGAGLVPPRVPGTPARDVVEVPFRGRSGLADEVAGYGAAVVVLEPADLRAEVLRRLHAAAGVATGATGATGPASGTSTGTGTNEEATRG
ncbi:WYL domain-containing protein [Antribacter sp. KLBMP9083]|uniref:WYL domain-containing protein n=1 Tax=Antribacter soli TaxID=2910976 RepID=A0AA41UB83_9MICO|nr:WYL domain-containing protein [Antribacter soli]MCF4120839.1 WYL domain-containing protein [Antribacter soli]